MGCLRLVPGWLLAWLVVVEAGVIEVVGGGEAMVVVPVFELLVLLG